MTNGDKIRAMSDEELAVVIMCKNDMVKLGAGCTNPNQNCVNCSFEWLKEEAGE